MTKPLPRWIMHRYSVLWNKFSSKEFSHKDANSALSKDSMTSIVLSGLRLNGWLEIRLDPHDARKRLYKLKSPEEAVKEMAG